MGRWRAAVLLGVHLLIGLHIAHWLLAGETLTPVEPSEAMAYSQHSIINAGLVFFVVMILLTAVFGRFFCGWGCHLLALQDLCRHWLLKVGITPQPLRTRTLVWVPTLAFLYMFIWPLLYRLWIGDPIGVRGTEFTTAHFWATFPGLAIAVLTFLVCGFLCVVFLGSKGFCTYACPYGAIFAAADRVAPMRIRVSEACNQCGHCTAVCSSNVRVHQEVRDWGMVVSPGCMKCQDCVSVCPTQALRYGPGPIPLFAKPRSGRPPARPRQAPWSEELVLALSFAASFLIVRGLYGAVPFLMALGVAAVVAFLTLTAFRLWREATVERSGLRLKRAGRLLPQGRSYVVVYALLLAFLLHSSLLRYQAWRVEAVYEGLAERRMALLAAPGELPSLPDGLRGEVELALDRIRRIDAWGLFPTLGNAARQAWLETLLDRPDRAEQAAAQALERQELPAEMHQLRAHLFLRRGAVGPALGAWQAATRARPDQAEAWLAHGLHLARSGDLLLAREVFEHGAQAVGVSAELWYNLGLARALLGDGMAALDGFERALALRPDHQEARENLAGTLASLGQWQAAAMHYRVALQQAPADPETRLLLSRVLLASGERDAAVRELRQILAAEPGNAQAIALLAAADGD